MAENVKNSLAYDNCLLNTVIIDGNTLFFHFFVNIVITGAMAITGTPSLQGYFTDAHNVMHPKDTPFKQVIIKIIPLFHSQKEANQSTILSFARLY